MVRQKPGQNASRGAISMHYEVDFPPEEPRGSPDQHSHQHVQRGRNQTNQDRNSSPVDKAAEKVSPQLVGGVLTTRSTGTLDLTRRTISRACATPLLQWSMITSKSTSESSEGVP